MKHHPGDKVRYKGDDKGCKGLEGVIEKYMYRVRPFEGGHWPRKEVTWVSINEDSVELIERGSIEI